MYVFGGERGGELVCVCVSVHKYRFSNVCMFMTQYILLRKGNGVAVTLIAGFLLLSHPSLPLRLYYTFWVPTPLFSVTTAAPHTIHVHIHIHIYYTPLLPVFYSSKILPVFCDINNWMESPQTAIRWVSANILESQWYFTLNLQLNMENDFDIYFF